MAPPTIRTMAPLAIRTKAAPTPPVSFQTD